MMEWSALAALTVCIVGWLWLADERARAALEHAETERLQLLGGLLAAQIDNNLGAIDRALGDVIVDLLSDGHAPSPVVPRRLRALAHAMPSVRSLLVLD